MQNQKERSRYCPFPLSTTNLAEAISPMLSYVSIVGGVCNIESQKVLRRGGISRGREALDLPLQPFDDICKLSSFGSAKEKLSCQKM
jgi:hypothetical protein